MAHVTPFYQHISPALGQTAPLAGPPYPYYDHDQCPVGQQVKASDEWQYYRDEPDDQRTYCLICAGLASREPTPAAPMPTPAGASGPGSQPAASGTLAPST